MGSEEDGKGLKLESFFSSLCYGPFYAMPIAIDIASGYCYHEAEAIINKRRAPLLSA